MLIKERGPAVYATSLLLMELRLVMILISHCPSRGWQPSRRNY